MLKAYIGLASAYETFIEDETSDAARDLAAACAHMARIVGSVIRDLESRLEAAGQNELVAELAEYLSNCLGGNGADGRDSDGDTD
jgi:hypothetical protein